MRRAAAALALAACLGGCGSLATLQRPALPAYEAGAFDQAADLLPPLPAEGGKDRLLALCERGMILHAARRFEASNAALLEAAKLAESIELIHVAERAGTFVTNENFVDYRGEDYERVLVHVLAAMNFLGLRDPEGALVECRRMVEVHRKILAEREKEDRTNAFALFLSGLCYEIGNQPNDAYIDYAACHALAPDFPPLAESLLRLSHRLGMTQEHAAWKARFGGGDPPPAEGTGEVVLLLEAGLAPRKTPGGPLGIVPALEPRPVAACAAVLQRADGTPLAPTRVLCEVDAWARETLEERAALLMAKRAALLVVKEGVSRAVEKKHGELWGWLTRLFLFALERPDLRHWGTLPSSFQACRVRLPAGTLDLRVQPVDAAGAPAAAPVDFPGVEVRPGQVVVLIARTVQ